MKKRLSVPLLRACAWFCGGISLAAVFAFAFRQEAPVFAIGLEKMNVFYAGFDNPLSIVVRGVPEDQVRIEGDGISLEKMGPIQYVARTAARSKASITVSGGEMKPVTFTYRIKRIPDPGVYLGERRGGTIGVGEFKAQGGIHAPILNMDIDAKCNMMVYKLIRISGKEEPVTIDNTGPLYNPAAQNLVDRAISGDTYVFEDIRVMCPGDIVSRHMGSMIFKIK